MFVKWDFYIVSFFFFPVFFFPKFWKILGKLYVLFKSNSTFLQISLIFQTLKHKLLNIFELSRVSLIPIKIKEKFKSILRISILGINP